MRKNIFSVQIVLPKAIVWPLAIVFALLIDVKAQITTTSTQDVSRCIAGNVQLNTTPAGGTSYTYSWTPTGSLSNPAISNPIASPTATTTYYVTVTDIPSSNTVVDTVVVTIQNVPPPVAIEPSNLSFCQGDTIKLNVVNDNVCQDLTGTCQTTTSTQTVGSGTLFASTNATNPFFKQSNFLGNNRSTKHQYVFKASELKSSGLIGPTTISAISWDVTLGFGTMVYSNLTFKMGCSPDSILTSTFKSGLTTVYAPKSKTFSSTQWEQFTFDQPFVWDGQSNLILEVCFVNASASVGFPFIRYDSYGFNVANYVSANTDVCGSSSGTTDVSRPNTRFHHCDVVHSSALTYSWSPSAGLSSSSIKNPFAFPTVTTSYILTATDINGCYKIDTTDLTVAPQFNISVNNDTSLCADDTLTLVASHNAGAGASFRWSAPAWIENDTLSITRAFFNTSTKINFEIESQAGCAKSDSLQVNIVPPVTAGILTQDTTICAGDSLQLQISSNFYTCVTYSNVSCTSPSNLVITPTSTFASGGVTISPFDAVNSSAPGQKKQFLFLASELGSLSNSSLISALGFNIQNVGTSTTTRNGFTIKMGCTNITAFSTFSPAFETGMQTVFNPKTISLSTGWMDLTFDNAFVWDGISNVIVEICWQNSASLGFGIVSTQWSTTSFSSVAVNWNGSSFCTETTASFTTTIRPEMRFKYCTPPPNSLFDFLWSPSSVMSNDTLPEPKAAPSVSGFHYLTVTDPLSGCRDKDSVFITVAPNFTTSVTADTLLCEEDTLGLNVSHNSPAIVTYNWSPANKVSNVAISNPTSFITGSQKFISEVASSLGCIKWDTVNVTLFDKMNLSIIAPSGLACEGDSVQLDELHTISCGVSNSTLCNPSDTLIIGSSSVSTGLFTTTPFVASSKSSRKQYIIRKAELLSAGITASSQLASISFDIATLGKSDYQGFTIKIGCTSMNSFNNSFNTNLVTVFDSKDVTLTAGKNWFSFDHRYNWDGSTNIVVDICYNNLSTGINSDVFYTLPSPIYNCTEYVTGNSVCQTNSGSSYNRRPSIEFTYCIIPSTNFNYSWTPASLFNNSGLKNPKAQLVLPADYKLKLTDINSNCSVEDSVTLDVHSIDVTALKDTSLCTSMNYQLDVLTTAVLPKYKWTPSIQVSNDTIKNPLITVDNGLNFIVEVTDTSGCTKKDTVDILLLPKPIANVTPSNITVCRDEPVQLQGSGGNTYLWKPATGISNPNLSSPVATVKGNTVYYLTVTNSFGCTDEDSVSISIFPSPLLDLGGDTSYCNGGSITLNAGAGFTSYKWQDNSNDSIYLVNSNGVYWVIVTDGFNCTFKDTVNIGIATSPSTNIDYNTDVCIGDSVILDALNDGANYLWSTGETSKTIVVKDSGMYWVKIDNGQCIGSDSTIVRLYEYPYSYMADIEYYCEKEFPFGMTLTAGGDEYRYKWDNGQVTNYIIVSQEGEYSVLITNGDKCSIEKSVTVKQLCKEVIFVPNSFTPNNDSKNDVFRITALNTDEFEFRIFNRWGEQIYFTDNPNFEWSGEKDGKPLTQGTYVWTLIYKMKQADGSLEEFKENGTLTLIR